MSLTEGEKMDILEIERKETMTREEAAARLRAFADTLARNNDIEFDRGGIHMKVHVPDEIQVKVELEIESDENELEIELSW
jgi:amphi-Trp domain-containing protein